MVPEALAKGLSLAKIPAESCRPSKKLPFSEKNALEFSRQVKEN